MHSTRWSGLRMAHCLLGRRSCRVVAGVRRQPAPLRQRRSFHRSAIAYRIPDDRAGPSKDDAQRGTDENSVESKEHATEDETKTADDGSNAALAEPKDDAKGSTRRDGYGSGLRRASRNKRSREVPSLDLPSWFLENNVKCSGSPGARKLVLSVGEEYRPPRSRSSDAPSHEMERTDAPDVSLPRDQAYLSLLWLANRLGSEGSSGRPSGNITDYEKAFSEVQAAIEQFATSKTESSGSDADIPPLAVDVLDKYKERLPSLVEVNSSYLVDRSVMLEVLATVRAALTIVPPSGLDASEILRPDIVLYCPKDSGATFLDSVVETVAAYLKTDLVQIDAEDIAEIVSGYMGESVAWTGDSSSSLAYAVHESSGKMEKHPSKDDRRDRDGPEDEDVERRNVTSTIIPLQPGSQPTRLPRHLELAPKAIKWLQESLNGEPASTKSDSWTDLKLSASLGAIVDAAKSKRLSEDPAEDASPADVNKTILIQIKGYREILASEGGEKVIEKIHDVAMKRWQNGERIAIIGTTCMNATEDGKPIFSWSEIRNAQSDVEDGMTYTVFVPPHRDAQQDEIFTRDEQNRIRRINMRHLEHMVNGFLLGSIDQIAPEDLRRALEGETASIYTKDIGDHVWGYARTYRAAISLIGTTLTNDSMQSNGIEAMGASKAEQSQASKLADALWILARSDQTKLQWSLEETGQHDQESGKTGAHSSPAAAARDEKIKSLKQRCNKHEARLLNGIIDPANIRTNFSTVHAPKATIDALKTLTSLSFLRPDAFAYGVLATDKIPGVLLYGPPGTGKTLLAKALAKESGVTMLEVSGADLNDMYVGEGEKNVKALFSLAKKLSPCVVFLDEADAILGARSGDSRRASHRDIINEFLREWDGMNDLSAFIMVATNRPFDLDEAVLRRLPRRLLIDLPSETERHAILKIHLKDELLADSVSLSKIARETPFYSGSDLKNLSVAAALACLREENELAHAAAQQALQDAGDPLADAPRPVYPARRTLTAAHFDTAMQEISASSSDDTRTLEAIRKFDEKYGDRKGRRKKRPDLGFGGTRTAERDSEAARVRKIAA